MKHIRNKTVLAMAAAVALLLCGCTKELPNEDFGEESYLSLSIDGQQAPSSAAAYDIAAESATRQGAATRAVDESAVSNLWVLQFKMTMGSTTAGTLVKKFYIPSVTDITKIKYSPEAGADMALYLVANTGDATLFNSMSINTPLANAKKATVNVTANTSTSLPMVGQSANLTLPTTTVPVTLTRTVAKVILTVKNLLATTTSYPQLTVTSTQIRNIPNIYSTQVVNSTSGFTGTTYYPPVSTTNYFTNSPAASGNITATGTTTTYYVAPNVRGIGTATDDRLKGPDTAPSGQGAYCTYVEILGTAKATSSSPAVDVCYRLYLGGNSTNNYNLYSNTAYKVGIELTGLSAADARLTITTDKFDLVQGGIDGDHTSDAGDGWVEPVIGALKGGGIVYWVDPNNPNKYKVVSLTTDSRKWSSNYDNIPGTQNDTDGKAIASAIKDFYDTKYAATMTFDVAFPAAAYCYNYKGKDDSDPIGTWYLPAKTDLQYLWCAFNGKAPISWASGTNTNAGANTADQGVFNDYLTAADGTPIADSGHVWSGTQYSDGADAWAVNFSTGHTEYVDKTSYSRAVRCIRDF